MAVGMAVEGKRESQVEEQMNYISNNIGRLDDEIEKLYSRIECVVRAEQPAPTGPDKAAEQLVTMASRLQQFTYQVDGLVSKIRSIRERTEL